MRPRLLDHARLHRPRNAGLRALPQPLRVTRLDSSPDSPALNTEVSHAVRGYCTRRRQYEPTAACRGGARAQDFRALRLRSRAATLGDLSLRMAASRPSDP